jgi:hypothetical protein
MMPGGDQEARDQPAQSGQMGEVQNQVEVVAKQAIVIEPQGKAIAVAA